MAAFTYRATRATALSLSLICSMAMAQGSMTAAWAQTAQTNNATDKFKHRKRYIVPSSDTSRRIDYQSMSTRDSLMLPTYVPQPPSGGTTSPGMGTYKSSSQQYAETTTNISREIPEQDMAAQAGALNYRSGLTPPPPAHAGASKLVPNSLTKTSQTSSQAPSQTPAATNNFLSPQHLAQIKGEAQTLVKRGRLADAQELLTRYHQEYPNEPQIKSELSRVSLLRAKQHQTAKQYDAAAKHARTAIAYADKTPTGQTSTTAQAAQTTLSESLTKMGVDAKNHEQRHGLGEKLSDQGKHIEAEVEFAEAARLNPQFKSYMGAGDAALKANRKTQAKEYFQKALEIDPDSQTALRQLGITRYKLNDHAGANADLTRALVLNPHDTQAADTLNQLWQNQISLRPNDAASHLGMARAYQVAGDLASAQNEYKKVVALDPHHPNLPAARQSFKLALARQEANKSFEMARTLESQGSLNSAYQKATDAVELYPGEPRYQNYKTMLGEKLTLAGLPLTAVAGQATAAFAGLVRGQEAPPTASIPTAGALGLGMTPQAQNAAAVNTAMGGPLGLSSPFQAENMYRPMSTDQHVSNISGFLTDIRNFALQQQNQIRGAETDAQSMISAIGKMPMTQTTQQITVTQTTTDNRPVSTAPATSESALAAAARALANTQAIGNAVTSTTGISVPAAPMSAVAQSLGPMTVATPTAASSAIDFAGLRINEPALAAGLNMAPVPIQVASETIPQVAPPIARLKAPIPVPNVSTPNVIVQPDNTDLNLMLTGVKAAKNDVQLKVVLANNGKESVHLPAAIKAMVRGSAGEQTAKATFASRILAPGDSVTGMIQVPGKSLDPRSDIIVPIAGPSSSGSKTPLLVHLSVPGAASK